jgi:hypothetical protein
MVKIEKIISGGQTGADRAALDFAIDNNISHGGWIPKGRKTETSQLPGKYHLQEMATASYSKRTEQNVIDSDGTIIVSHGKLTGGSALTQTFAIKHHKLCLHLDMDNTTITEAADSLNNWIRKNKIKILNVAGPRANKDNKIYQVIRDILEAAFIKDKEFYNDSPRINLRDKISCPQSPEIPTFQGCRGFQKGTDKIRAMG